jgi:hypothetical protein
LSLDALSISALDLRDWDSFTEGLVVRRFGMALLCLLLASCNQNESTMNPWPMKKYESPSVPVARPVECQTPDWLGCGKKHLETHVQMRTRFEFFFGFKSYAEAVAVLQPDGVRIPANSIELRYQMSNGAIRSKICHGADTCAVNLNEIDRIECVGATVTLDGQSVSNSAGMPGCPRL